MYTFDRHNTIDAVRQFIYTHVADTGAPPTAAAIAEHIKLSAYDAFETLKILGATKRVVLDPASGEVWMCGPFSAVPTRFAVSANGVRWFANCAWDMLGIPASLGISATVDTSCACCNEPTSIEVDATTGPTTDEGIVHIMLPARRWYDDIGFT